MIPGSTTGNFYGVYMEMFKTKLGKSNVCKKHEKSNIRPVLSLQDSSGTCPEVPPGPEGQARPDLSPTFEYSGYLVFPRDLNYFCIANLNCIANTKVVYLKYSKH